MPKRKKMNYKNSISEEDKEKFLNKWLSHFEENTKVFGVMFETTEGALIQMLVSEDEKYNSIYHIKTFKIKNEEIAIDEIDVLHNPKRESLNELIEQLPDIMDRFCGTKPNNFEEILKVNPFENKETLTHLLLV